MLIPISISTAIPTTTTTTTTNTKARRRGGLSPTAEELEVAKRVLAKLSERSGRAYSPEAHAALVVNRLRDGATEEDLRTVVWDRANRWHGHPEMDEYLRPSTLFAPKKFPEYLAAARAAWDRLERDESARAQAPPPVLFTARGDG